MKTIFLDIMLNSRYVRTLKYKFCPLFNINMDDLRKYVVSKMPALKGKPFKIEFDYDRH